MYSSFQLFKKYISYWITASNGKGHGLHSPFVFELVEKVLNDKQPYACYPVFEKIRKGLLRQKGSIEVMDFGAGSAVIKTRSRAIADIAASSLKSRKYARLLYRMVRFYKPNTIIELGTSFGLTSAYLASGNPTGKVYTLEGSPAIAAIAQKTFEKASVHNIELITGEFGKKLPALLQNLGKVDLVFIDGNHRKEPTLDYFNLLLSHKSGSTILVFDDIHWSEEMESAWAEVKTHPSVTMTIDLFFIGIVFFNPDFKIPQHFTIRF